VLKAALPASLFSSSRSVLSRFLRRGDWVVKPIGT
jgi:hypothetical protein